MNNIIYFHHHEIKKNIISKSLDKNVLGTRIYLFVIDIVRLEEI